MSKIRIGELLVKSGHIEQWQLDKALEVQKEEGGMLGEILIKKGFIADSVLIEALTCQAEEIE